MSNILKEEGNSSELITIAANSYEKLRFNEEIIITPDSYKLER